MQPLRVALLPRESGSESESDEGGQASWVARMFARVLGEPCCVCARACGTRRLPCGHAIHDSCLGGGGAHAPPNACPACATEAAQTLARGVSRSASVARVMRDRARQRSVLRLP